MVDATDRVELVNAYDLTEDMDLNVALGIAVVSTGGIGIYGEYPGHAVAVNGYVYGAFGGIFLGNLSATPGTTNQSVTIGAKGRVAAGSAMGAVGVAIESGSSILVNNGVISGHMAVSMSALATTSAPNAQSQLINTGKIQGLQWGIDRSPLASETLRILNKGLIAAQNFAIDGGGNSVEIVINQGRIRGIIDLGAGNDVYDGRKGILLPLSGEVMGEVRLGDGNDLIRPGASREAFYGGAGDDTIDFRFSGAVHLSLDRTIAAKGAAAGDQYADFKNIEGSLKGHDKLVGSSDLNFLANVLKGHGGNDTLSGLNGADTLVGGAGRDRLIGGEGSDIFIYNSAAEGRDVITDFTNTATSDDTFYLRLSGFKAGLALGALNAERLHIGRSNRAAERDDRFIFDKKTTTLWFDADGSGRKGPVLIADLQAGAVLTAADIYIMA